MNQSYIPNISYQDSKYPITTPPVSESFIIDEGTGTMMSTSAIRSTHQAKNGINSCYVDNPLQMTSTFLNRSFAKLQGSKSK